MGGSVHSVKEKAESLLVTSKEIGLEINADKTKYKVSRLKCRTKSQYKTDNNSLERVEEIKYLGTTLTNQNSIQEEFYVLLTVHLGIIFVNN